MRMNREELALHFASEFEKLNEKQRLAVDTLEGPVMVIAGPGTGKTQILASRIGKILLETDAAPENILCLTYTEAGVVAMRKRLLQFIGPDAYKVNIYTFHAFCNDVIQENLSLFEKTALDPVSELESIALFKELIDTLPKNNPLKRYRGDVYYEVRNLQQLFSTMKKEGWTPEWIIQKIDEYINDLPNRDEYIAKRAVKEFKKGDVRTDKIAEEKEKTEKLRAAVKEFPRYQEMMRRHNRYDFDDMINWVIRAFETNKNLLSNYQEKFQYILVDEYQDTSGTQNRIVELLISYWDKPNVFVVGDDDQSIYRFQGANIENMLQFADNYKEHLFTVVLTHNYRSTQPILDLSKALISRNNERLVNKLPDLSKDLEAKGKFADIHAAPAVVEYETQRSEMIGITKAVQELTRQGVAPGKIAIIYKENKYGEELTRYFSRLDIPVYSKRSMNILEIPLARKVILMLKYIAAELDTPYGGDEMLFEILHAQWWNIPPIEIAKLSVEVADTNSSRGEKTSLRRRLLEKALTPPKDLFSAGLPEPMRKASEVLEQLIQDAPNSTLQHLFEKIIRKTGVLTSIMQSPEKHFELQVITGIFDFLKEETRRKPLMDIQELVALFALMEKEEIRLPLVQVSGTEKGVNLLTAHSSKGLEFEFVFLAGCNASIWEKKRKPSGGYTLPDTLFASQPQSRDEEELRRLFYVATTRAEKELAISYSRFKNDGKEMEPSRFVAEILDGLQLSTSPGIVTAEDIAAFSILQFGEDTAPEIEAMEAAFIDPLLDKFVMNVTALNNFLHCPLEFYFNNLVRIPSPKNEATEFGSAVHFALEKLFKRMQDEGTEQFPPKAVFIEDFEWYMQRHRESFTQEQFDRRMEYGREVLDKYYDNRVPAFSRIVVTERFIKNVTVNGVPLKGKLDKLEFEGKSVNVVDYKTGDPDKALPKLKGPDAKNPDGGDYWRQAVFYKLLVDHYEQKDWKAISTEFDFIEPDKKKQYRKEKVMITPPDLETVKQQISTVWDRIKAKDFYTGCGKEDCHWCAFVKTNNLAIALHDLEEPET